jgi:hypothetical protein
LFGCALSHPHRAASIAATSIFFMPIMASNALCFIAARGQRFGQHAGRDLPANAPLVFAPATLAFLPAIADDGVPVAIGLVLIVGGDLQREGFVVFERGAAIKPDARDAGNREFDRQHIARLAGWEVARRTVAPTTPSGKVAA